MPTIKMKTFYKTALILFSLQLFATAQNIDSCKQIKLQYDNYHKTNTIIYTSFGLYSILATFCMVDMFAAPTHMYTKSTSVDGDNAVLLSYAVLFYPTLGILFYRHYKIKKIKARLLACYNSVSLNIDF